MRSRQVLVCAATILLGACVGVLAQRRDAFQESVTHPAIEYLTRPVRDPVGQLAQKIQAGTTRLAFDPTSGYLSSLLAALNIPVESQMLVFSKTSAQASHIDPRNPRALFFGDNVSVAWVRDTDTLELAAQDPQQGVVFYTLEQRAASTPHLERQTAECLMCHLTWDTLAVPGFIVLSTFPMSDDPNAYANGVVVDHRTPLDQRWGGWFVTGTSVPRMHRGNVPVIQPAAELAKPPVPPPVLKTVNDRVDTAGYPSAHSDIVPLMVFEHQAHMTNLLTHLGWEARVAAGGGTQISVRVTDAARDLVDYMLFVDEARIPSKIEGSSGFAEKFSAMGPTDTRGRSLRQLDLTRRLMRYPCSYMIYSEAFETLPAPAKDAAYRRLWQVLSGQDTNKRYTLSRADRQAIVEILRATKKDLPAYFASVTR